MQTRCQGLTKLGTKCKRNHNCIWHKLETCPVCLEEVPFKLSHVTTCRHTYHKECITRWFEASDECPVCRSEQSTDPLIVFKRNIKKIMEETYMDAIHSLENDNERLRRRRARARREV